MATVVLRSQDCLRDRFHPETLTYSPLLKSRPNPNSNPNPNGTRARRRKRSPLGFQDNGNDRVPDRYGSMVVKSPARNLVMGQVTILKRGEALSLPKNRGLGNDRKGRARREADLDLMLGSTDRLGPEPEMVQKEIRVSESKVVDGLYAGSAFFSSPPPSSLPLPLFFTKKDGSPIDEAIDEDGVGVGVGRGTPTTNPNYEISILPERASKSCFPFLLRSGNLNLGGQQAQIDPEFFTE
ncbi:hypothetical protein CK203_020170 [Vitis vinifera]|uniref:Uncharacterized protein n=1 Tax=Vitis vinifera TaxID=29760 RepID=A0A438J869_VITVI|nr:hypothetical protein CK203_020170 [Vitis vinifera]